MERDGLTHEDSSQPEASISGNPTGTKRDATEVAAGVIDSSHGLELLDEMPAGDGVTTRTIAEESLAGMNHDGGRGRAGAAGRSSKKPRLVWTTELHQRFLNAVNHLGVKSAVPKTILQLMNVEGMTRENVASHLQKYRLYLKRLQGLPSSAQLPDDRRHAVPYNPQPAPVAYPHSHMAQPAMGMPPGHPASYHPQALQSMHRSPAVGGVGPSSPAGGVAAPQVPAMGGLYPHHPQHPPMPQAHPYAFPGYGGLPGSLAAAASLAAYRPVSVASSAGTTSPSAVGAISESAAAHMAAAVAAAAQAQAQAQVHNGGYPHHAGLAAGAPPMAGYMGSPAIPAYMAASAGYFPPTTSGYMATPASHSQSSMGYGAPPGWMSASAAGIPPGWPGNLPGSASQL